MPAIDMTKWPHNGQPSSRHVWKETWTGLDTGSGHASVCLRCDRRFNHARQNHSSLRRN